MVFKLCARADATILETIAVVTHSQARIKL